MKPALYICLFLSAASLFFSIERCSSNSNKVAAINNSLHKSRFKGFGSETEIKPAMPTSTKYGLFFFFTFTLASIILLKKSKPKDTTITPYMKLKTEQTLHNKEEALTEKSKTKKPTLILVEKPKIKNQKK